MEYGAQAGAFGDYVADRPELLWRAGDVFFLNMPLRGRSTTRNRP